MVQECAQVIPKMEEDQKLLASVNEESTGVHMAQLHPLMSRDIPFDHCVSQTTSKGEERVREMKWEVEQYALYRCKY